MSDEVLKLQLINAALTSVGDKRQSVLSSGADNTIPLEDNYEGIVEAALTSGPEWRFATFTRAPTHIGERADKIFKHEWSLPPNLLELKAVLRSIGGGEPFPFNEWEVEESILLNDYDAGIFVRGIFRAGETFWHPNFRLGIQYMLEGVAERAFWEDESSASAREAAAAIQFGLAARAAGHKRKVESRSIMRRRYGRFS